MDEHRRENRRAADGDLARVLRFMDGAGDDPGCIVRLDRLERHLRVIDARSRANEGRLRILGAFAEGHPLLDKKIAQEVVDYIRSGEDRGRRFGQVAGYVGRQSIATVVAVLNAVLIGWLIIHGIPAAK